MDILLVLFLTLVITFLICEATIYIVRPPILLSEEDEVLMWHGFMFSLIMAVFAVAICSLLIYYNLNCWYCCARE